jgi:hypothetical protein
VFSLEILQPDFHNQLRIWFPSSFVANLICIQPSLFHNPNFVFSLYKGGEEASGQPGEGKQQQPPQIQQQP